MTKILSKSIFKQSIRNNWKLWTILTGVLCLFITLITFVITSATDGGRPGMPGGINLINIYGQMFFGMMGIMMLLIYAIATGNKLVASEIDKGTMSFILNTPITRKQVIFSKALFYILSIALMAALMGGFATFSSLIVGAEIDYNSLWLLILGFVLFGFATSGISFASSCWFNKSSLSLLVGAGLPVSFWLLSQLSSIPDLEFLKYFSLNTLFDTTAIISGNGFIVQFIALGGIAVILYILGILKFLKKDLPL